MIAQAYMSYGLSRDKVLSITKLTKHQLYHKSNEKKPGKRPTQITMWKERATQQILQRPNEE